MGTVCRSSMVQLSVLVQCEGVTSAKLCIYIVTQFTRWVIMHWPQFSYDLYLYEYTLVNWCTLITWEHLPYLAGWESAVQPAKVSRLNHTFFRGSNLLTLAGWQPLAQPANLSRLNGTFRRWRLFVTQPANLGRFTDTFRTSTFTASFQMSSTC